MIRRASVLAVLAVSGLFFLPKLASAQIDKIVIPAGTPEDRELQAISNEQDSSKKLAMYQDFVQKYSANPAAVAFGNWQMSQAYQGTGDLAKALDCGDKALAAAPRNLDILVSQASIAQQAKDNAKLMTYVAKGGSVCLSIGKQAKPEGISDEDFAKQIAEEKESVKVSCSFLESAGFNVIASETDAKSRMAYIETYSAAFPESPFQDQGFELCHVHARPRPVERSGKAVCLWRKNSRSESEFFAGLAAPRRRQRRRSAAGKSGKGNFVFAEGDHGREGRRSRCG